MCKEGSLNDDDDANYVDDDADIVSDDINKKQNIAKEMPSQPPYPSSYRCFEVLVC